MSTESFGPSALATPANALTMIRVIATPVLLIMVMNDGPTWAAVAVWVGVAITDMADGVVARRQGQTRSGAFLDPLADKVLVVGVMAALVAKGRLWWVPVVLIGMRELIVSGYRSWVGRRGVSVPARPWAKVKTVVQDLAVGFALAPIDSSNYRHFVAGLLWVAVALTVVTGAQYLIDGRRQVLRAV
ncbi:MAG: CDP-diacylglycerol--glycerol-3-phosphate 3-phosphatidyltransferase [Acidimicrobiia bacterium]|nr:CDP-diacylglycerol--glycerol-3-phosphate 3-phosphatidyltransferase [Acidimicrobiia bacterium]